MLPVKFRYQSVLSIVLGILTILGSFATFAFPSGDMFFRIIMFFSTFLFGIALVSLGARRVPDYDDFFKKISESIDKKIVDYHGKTDDFTKSENS